MMTSPNPYLRSSRKRSRLGPIVTTVAVLLVLALVLYFRAPLSGVVFKVFSPVFAARNALGQNAAGVLEAQLASTTLALQDRNQLKLENDTLKKMLGRTIDRPTVLAAVLVRPPAVPYDTMVIDAGSSAGVAVGSFVYGGGSTVIGMVSDVSATTARVTLLSSPGRSFDAQITPTQAPGTTIPLPLQGQGGGSLMGQVPAGSPVSVGDPIVVPGVVGAYVGSVSHIDVQSGASFANIYAQLPVSPFSLEFVEVETK